MKWLPRAFLALALCLNLSLQAKEAADLAADPVAEKRLMDISAELRCLVCQNQTIADSHADLALDLRREIRSMIQQGKSDKEILDFMVARYGDFVLYRPPVQNNTALLWFGPLLILAVGLGALLRYLRRRSQAVAAAPAGLSEDERRRAEALLREAQSSATKDSAP
ncbi:MAG: cytochrome c-type biogenesis protein CcmH [Polyangiaceae bacterium]